MLPEIANPILNSPYEEPDQYWLIHPSEPAQKVGTRRPASYFYNETGSPEASEGEEKPLDTVNTIREQLAEWLPQALEGGGGVTKTTANLLEYWYDESRDNKLFYAQLEAATTIIFLTESRNDFRQGINIPLDYTNHDQTQALKRYCCRMATGSGKTTVMGMLAAWNILNKVADITNSNYSDAILVVCPNRTILKRLEELKPEKGYASIYRVRDLVPDSYMPMLQQGKVIVTNWHVFETQSNNRRMVTIGVPKLVRETIWLGEKNTTARGKRYMTSDELNRQSMLGHIVINKEIRDKNNNEMTGVQVESTKYFESDRALVNRILKKEFGEKKNIMIFNDEAHHAYRMQEELTDLADDNFDNVTEAERHYRQATVWVEGLDKIDKIRQINYCVDFSATPYYLQRAGRDTNKIFPWTVSSFSLQDAIESGLVKIPQLPVKDSGGELESAYYNIWKWIKDKLTPTERGGARNDPSPAAILKYAHTPIAMLCGQWERERIERSDEARPPVIIIVCKTTKLAKAVFEWLANDKPPRTDIPKAQIPTLLNSEDKTNTIRVDSKVSDETDGSNTKNDERRWMRFQLDTIGKLTWPTDANGQYIYPDEFTETIESLAKNDSRYSQYLHYPPGRDIRCVISVGMLTEGWDCNTVSHIIGLRPFMSQLLCEQVIGRGLRRRSYLVNSDTGLMNEEVSTILGVPLTTFPVKVSENGKSTNKRQETRICHLHSRINLKITFPRVIWFQQLIQHSLKGELDDMPDLVVGDESIPQVVYVNAGLPDTSGQIASPGPGKEKAITLSDYRKLFRLQKALFDVTHALTQHFNVEQSLIPSNVLFVQIREIITRYIRHKVKLKGVAQLSDAFISPYYGRLIEILQQGIQPDTTAGELPELPRYDPEAGLGSTRDIDFNTIVTPVYVTNSHVNAIVPDSELETNTALKLDKHEAVISFTKNYRKILEIPYLHNGEKHVYIPDFIVSLKNGIKLLLETKGFDDELEDVKSKAAERWVRAVNADNKHGHWQFSLIRNARDLDKCITNALSTTI